MIILKIQSWTGLDGSVDRIWPAGRQLIITDVDHGCGDDGDSWC